MNGPTGLAYRYATWFGVGHARAAPGTLAALFAFPLHWGLGALGAPTHLALLVAFTILGIWSAQQVSEALRAKDPQVVVIDEVLGALVALWIAGGGVGAQVAAVLLFRVLDIGKPWPIRAIERCKPPGFGIVADDLAAGLIAGLLVRLV